MPCSELYSFSLSTSALSRGSPTNRKPFASAAGPRNSGSDSIELHSDTQQPHMMQSDSLWIGFICSWENVHSRSGGSS